MAHSFKTTLNKDGSLNATGIEVPQDIIDALGSGKKPKVKVDVSGYAYRSTVAVMDGHYMIPFSQAHREASGIKPGQTVDVALEIDTESRTVELPDDLAAALDAKAGARAEFDKVSDSKRKEFVRQVVEAKAQETRDRRVAGIVAQFGNS